MARGRPERSLVLTGLRGEPLVDRKPVVGALVMGVGSVDQVPHVVAVHPFLGELIDEDFPVEERDGHCIGDVHLRADRL